MAKFLENFWVVVYILQSSPLASQDYHNIAKKYKFLNVYTNNDSLKGIFIHIMMNKRKVLRI